MTKPLKPLINATSNIAVKTSHSRQSWLEGRKFADGFLKIKLYRGFIGLPKKLRDNAKCLGLYKRFQTTYVPIIPETVGNLLKIKELVKVEYVKEKPVETKPMYPPGYQVVGNYLAGKSLDLKVVRK